MKQQVVNLDNEKIWCHGQGMLGLQSYLEPSLLSQKDFSGLQKFTGFCYSRSEGTVQPWSFKRTSYESAGICFLADYHFETEQLSSEMILKNKELWEFYCSCWQHYLSKVKGKIALRFYSPYFIYADTENLLLVPPLLQNFLLENQCEQRYQKWVAHYHHPLWQGETALSYAFAVEHYELGCSKYFSSAGDREQYLVNKDYIPLSLRAPTVTRGVSRLVDRALQAHRAEDLPLIKEWQQLDPSIERHLDILILEKAYERTKNLEKQIKNKARITHFYLKYRLLILGISFSVLSYFLAKIFIF